MNSHLRKDVKEEGSFSEWDAEMKNNWSNLINMPLIYPKKNLQAKKDRRWVSPPT